ncbi:MAG: DUF4412 domain-containing protein [Candidatus Omnitrophota bacterium]
MKHNITGLGMIVLLFSFFLAGTAGAQEFSADMVTTSKDGDYSGKIFVSKDKIRMEIPGSTVISRLDKNVAWILMQQEKMYMEQPLNAQQITQASEKIPGEIKRLLIGQEMVDRKMTDKYKVTYTYNGNLETMFQWIAKGISLPVKTASGDGRWVMEYKNVKEGPQQAALFEIPPGYNKFSFQMPATKDMMQD